MGDPKVKGLAFRSVLKSLEALRGQAAVAAALGAMDPEVADAYRRNTILATGWYPIAWYREAFRAIVATTSPELPRAIGAEAIRADLDGVHKLMLRMLSPETVFSLSSKLFGKYYDTGSLRIAEGRNGFTRAEAGGCTGWDLGKKRRAVHAQAHEVGARAALEGIPPPIAGAAVRRQRDHHAAVAAGVDPVRLADAREQARHASSRASAGRIVTRAPASCRHTAPHCLSLRRPRPPPRMMPHLGRARAAGRRVAPAGAGGRIACGAAAPRGDAARVGAALAHRAVAVRDALEPAALGGADHRLDAVAVVDARAAGVR
ncbi:MAG: hypothetical protein IT376_10775 [Polyangiaceae bacterium]|nr:hypothetical protein [Polyangiaceae bacterium]